MASKAATRFAVLGWVVVQAASVFRQVVRDYCKRLSRLEVLVPLSVTVVNGISKELLPTDKELKGIYLS